MCQHMMICEEFAAREGARPRILSRTFDLQQSEVSSQPNWYDAR